MSRKRVYPEAKGSHLASGLERKRAAKILKKAAKKGRKVATMMNGTTTNGVSKARKQEPLKPTARKRQRQGKALPSKMAQFLISEIDRRGRYTAANEFCSFDADMEGREGPALQSISALIRDPGKRWWTPNYRRFEALAKKWRSEPVEVSPAPANTSSLALPQQFQQQDPNAWISTLSQAITTTLVSVMGPMLQAQGSRLPQLPAPAPEHTPEPPPRKDFPDLPDAMQRAILNSMHNRYAEILKRQGISDRPFAEAWRQSYSAFHRATGINIEAMASEESDRSGSHVRPLEIIQRSGNLVRFWGIVRKAWGDDEG